MSKFALPVNKKHSGHTTKATAWPIGSASCRAGRNPRCHEAAHTRRRCVAGVGGAVQPAFLQGFGWLVSLFLEYQHTWWQDATFNTPTASPLFNYTFRREDGMLKFGVTVSLGSPPPASPRSSMVTKAPPSK